MKGMFFDRDDTLIRDSGYTRRSEDVCLLHGVRDALKMAMNKGYKLFLFTNQSGVSRGMYNLNDVDICNKKMIELIDLGSDIFADICIATELPSENPIYRKPSPRFILEMIEKHNLSKADSYMIGDRKSDVQAGLNAKINAIFIGSINLIKPEDNNFLKENKINVFQSVFDFISSI